MVEIQMSYHRMGYLGAEYEGGSDGSARPILEPGGRRSGARNPSPRAIKVRFGHCGTVDTALTW